MKYIPIILLVISFASCRTVKNTQTVKTVYDSTYVKKYDSLVQVKREDSAAYVSMIESLSENTIIFQDTGRVVTKIEYYPDGSLKTVEGNLKSVTARLSKESNEKAYWKSKYDSLASTSKAEEGNVTKETMIITKTVKKTRVPLFMWLLILPGFALWLWEKWQQRKRKLLFGDGVR